MRYFSRFSPFAAIRDLRQFLAQRRPHELWFGILAIVLTGLILVGFVKDSKVEKPYESNIVYVKQWAADRSDQQIVAQQKVDQVDIDRRKAELERKRKERQAEFQRLDKRLQDMGF